MPIITVDGEFNDLMRRDVKEKISNAFVCLLANLYEISPDLSSVDRAKMIEGKAGQMKNELNRFIDLQAKMIIEDLEKKAKVDLQHSE